MFETISNFFKSINENQIENDKEKMNKILNSESLTCKECNNLAYPVWGTKNKYRCTKCDRRFTNDNHNLVGIVLNKFGLSGYRNYSKDKENELKLIYENCIKL